MAFHASERHVSLSRLQIARMVFVFAVAAFALGRTLPDALRIVWPLTVFGYYTDAAGTITTVLPKSPADRAGIVVGDRVDVRDFEPVDRKPGLIGKTFSAYNPIRHFTIIREGIRMAFELKGVPEPLETRFVIFLRELVALVSISIAALLAIVRPNRASLGFFHFVVGGGVYPNAMTSIWLDYPWRMIVDIANDVLVSGSLIGLLMFSLGFPHDLPRRMRIPTDIVGGVAWAACAALAIYADIQPTYFAHEAIAEAHAYHIIQTAIAALAFFSFMVTLIRTRGADRERVAWIVGAFMIALAGQVIADRFYPGVLRSWEYSTLQLLPILPTAVVFYGAMRYHILGIDFIVNRAIVYAAMTFAIVGIISLIEEGFSYWFVMNTNIAYALIIGMTIVFASFFSRIRDAIRRVVDKLIFRDRLSARQELESLAHALPQATDRERIEYALTSAVQQSLDLRCAALFELRGDHFVVIADAHWPPSASKIPADDPMLRGLVRSGGSEFIDDADWMRWSPDLKSVTPRLALPIDADSPVPLVAIYGLEISGIDLDVDEVRALEHLARGASSGYGNLRTRALATHLEELMQLRDENNALRARLAELEGRRGGNPAYGSQGAGGLS